ncbi:MAG TPA: hypothetical protein VFE91_00395 [Nitrososphaerales archaeon]|nr:hypothetical protein [Nitrososphaerales archaeon]
MIRRILETSYKKTIGALGATLSSFFTTITRGGGLVELLYVLLLVGLMAGFIDAVVFPVPNQSLVVYPSGGAQTVPEAVLDAFVIFVGGAGVYLAYISGRQTTRSRTVTLFLGLALLMIIVSVFTGMELAILKGFG